MNVYDLEDDLIYDLEDDLKIKGSSHVKRPSESMNSTKGLINIKNNDNCNASVANIYSTNTKLTV